MYPEPCNCMIIQMAETTFPVVAASLGVHAWRSTVVPLRRVASSRAGACTQNLPGIEEGQVLAAFLALVHFNTPS